MTVFAVGGDLLTVLKSFIMKVYEENADFFFFLCNSTSGQETVGLRANGKRVESPQEQLHCPNMFGH